MNKCELDIQTNGKDWQATTVEADSFYIREDRTLIFLLAAAPGGRIPRMPLPDDLSAFPDSVATLRDSAVAAYPPGFWHGVRELPSSDA